MESKKEFAGASHAPMKSPLAKIERRFIDSNVHLFPDWIGSQHLTLCTILWSIGIVLFGYLSKYSLHYLWLSSLMLFLQWFTDSFDGTLGKTRGQGLVKWGYYMDHFLDFIFIGALFVGYVFVVQDKDARLFAVMLIPIITAFWANSFLVFGVTQKFQITQLGIGPTEFRLIFILLNTFIIIFGVRAFEVILPTLLFTSIVCLLYVVHGHSREIWAIDMEAKKKQQEED
jgi:phosphatidylglycerophosphate synthase